MSAIDNYIAKVSDPQKTELERIRAIVKSATPDTVEVISYGMPGFKYRGKYLAGYAAFKDHLSLFPTAEPVEELKDKLSGYKLSKGTIQFTVEHPIPEALIKELVQIRMAAISGG